jgi:hypothetical protein
MLAAPAPPLKPRGNGSHFGLGWDVVLAEGGGFRYSKNGGVPGIHTYVEHLPSGVDWVVLLNGGDHRPGQPSALGYCTQRIRRVIQRTTSWPHRDLFEHPRPAARPSGTQTAGVPAGIRPLFPAVGSWQPVAGTNRSSEVVVLELSLPLALPYFSR